ncbi:MAG TPA: MogA/MoaB family molybdenum cofactor biosynthesis protein [Longilinea sp.]|nr:MogA/MoaB family molybdenum cofactor biosynthesis protein [Longilinea sp.]
MRFGVLTVSDRSSQGSRPDSSGPLLKISIASQGWQVVRIGIIPDDKATICATLTAWCDSNEIDILLTTGGTGFAPRDVTPEATLQVVERQAPGIPEAMRQASLSVTPHAMLSRAVAGIRGTTLIINLPGNPKAAMENFETVLQVLPHAVELIHGDPNSEAGHNRSSQ